MNIEKVLATPLALEWIEKLKQKHGPLLFHQSGGCCDGSSPMCFAQGDFLIGDQDVLLGEIGDCPFYMSANKNTKTTKKKHQPKEKKKKTKKKTTTEKIQKQKKNQQNK